MRNITSTITLLAKKVRAEGRAMAPIPLEKLEELAEHLQRLDRVVLAAESFTACCVGHIEAGHDTWSADEVEGLQYLREALAEVRS